MDRIPLRSGDFVWTLFPYDAEPNSPGPIRHAACVIAAFNQRDAAIKRLMPADAVSPPAKEKPDDRRKDY